MDILATKAAVPSPSSRGARSASSRCWFRTTKVRPGLEFYLLQRTDGLFLVERQGNDLLDFAKDLEYFNQLHG